MEALSTHSSKKEETVNKVTTVGLDLAKNIFHLVACDHRSKVLYRRRLTRNKLSAFFVQLPPCRIGMEACSSSHYWAREFTQLGMTFQGAG